MDYELPRSQAKGLIPLDQWQVVQQVEFVEKPFDLVGHRARMYLNPQNHQITIAPMPPEVTGAGLLGRRLTAMVAFQKAACHMSYSTIQQFFREVLNLRISRGQLAKTVSKVSRALEMPYEQLYQALRDQEHLGIDETGHKDQGI